MIQLITRTDISDYVQISDTVYDNVLNEHINNAQFIDVQKLMGADFFNDLIRNPTDANYVSLLDEGDYIHKGTTYTNYGLRAVIVYYTNSRYKLSGSQTDTPFGLVEKVTSDSTPVADSSKKTAHKMNQQIAYNYWENVRLFLDRNSDDYPLWRDSCVTQRSTFRISKIGGSTNVPRYRFKTR